MEFVLHIIILLFTFYALARVVDIFFVESLDLISKKLKLSSDIAGATFMAVGSSAPELFISFLALFRIAEQQVIGAGTIVGSAIFNILVIIGASALVRRTQLTWQPVIRDLVFYSLAILLLLFVFRDGYISLGDVMLFLSFYVVYLFSFKVWKKLFPYKTKGDELQEVIDELAEDIEEIEKSKLSITNIFDKVLTVLFVDLTRRPHLLFFNFVMSVLLIGVLSYFMVESAVEIAHFLGIPEVLIALTVLAVGTSIPDLLSSMKVAKMGKGDMAIANAVGSNIFDIAIGLGLPWLVLIVATRQSIEVSTESLNSSILLLFATVLILIFILAIKGWKLSRQSGAFLIALYILYLLTQIGIISFDMCLSIGQGYCFGI